MKIRAWFQAFRLRTLPLAFSCIFMGAFLAASAGVFNGWIFGLSLLTTLFLQVLSNLANDYGDAASGVDSSARSGPKRTVSSGLITRREMKNGLIVFSVLSLLSGVLLIFTAFSDQWVLVLVFLILGLGAIAAAIKYTVGKKPYGYAGWGDFFVLVFFGLVGVGGSYFLYSQSLSYWIILPALSCGLLAVGVLNVNNIRDIESDKQAGKLSIPVRIGRKRAIIYHWLILVLGLSAAVVYVIVHGPVPGGYLFLLTLPLFYINARAVKVKEHAAELDPFLRQLALSTLIFVVLFGIGQLIR